MDMEHNLTASEEFIRGLPKAELHLHIEGTLEPELLFELAHRNKVRLKYDSVDDLRNAYSFSRLQDFLDIYYAGTAVLLKEQDFYDLTRAYLDKAWEEHIFHTEIFFDPQSHTSRGIAFETVIAGITRAMKEAERNQGITSRLIPCFLRHLDEQAAISTYEESLPFREHIAGFGLDSSEKGNPPSRFRRVFERARADGFYTVAHAGEEGPAAYVREAIDILRVDRIDHGNHAIDDEALMAVLADRQIPLTMCPLSNLKLKVISDLRLHPLKKMLEQGVVVTLNSDDPAYFGGYLNENYLQIARSLNLSPAVIAQLAKNSFRASMLDSDTKIKNIGFIESYLKNSSFV